MPQENYILLIEDNPDDIFFLRRAITKAKPTFQVVVVTTGDEALSFISSERRHHPGGKGKPSLILLDLNLPRLNGLVLLEILKSKGWLDSVPAVMVSHSAEKLHELESMALGAWDFVKKPLTTAKVAELIEKYLTRQEASEEQAGAAAPGAATTAFAASMTPASDDLASTPEIIPSPETDSD